MPENSSQHRNRVLTGVSRARSWRGLAAAIFILAGATQARDLLRPNAPGPVAAATDGSSPTAAAATTAPALPSAQDRLARTTQALTAVKQMQESARQLAIAGPNNLRPNLPAVPLNSYGQPNGLVRASGANSVFWIGANTPILSTKTEAAATTTDVSITQTQQQAILAWDSFNLGKNTTLTFDQRAGGADVGQWIAFNYVRDSSGTPSQILGKLKTIGAPDAAGKEQAGGQVYVMNANGIIFGGSSQVNAHALVASSLPINYNLIQRGLLNNPDGQFLFTALPQPASGKWSTLAFDPGIATDSLGPVQTPSTADGRHGDVVVQAGAVIEAPTNADKVGGRIALIGLNVTNAGRISTPDGQTVLAAGLQVGFAPHASADPTLRGLDVFVGSVGDTTGGAVAGTVTNDRVVNGDGSVHTGLIEAPRGAITLTGKTVNQLGFLESSTSVSYNGRVDLVAGYNAVANPKYDPSLDATADFTLALPFFYQSNVGNNPAATAVPNSGAVTLGRESVLRVVPETTNVERAPGDLALRSQVNVQGESIYFGTNAVLFAPGAAVPLLKAIASDGRALEAGVTLRAGAWFNPGSTLYRFVQSSDVQQIYLDQGAVVDVAGLTGVSASVTENIVPVELRGSELANAPLQRDGPLRGKTIQVDVRRHGPWDPTLNNGLGGYAWVGTALANTSGWVALASHTVGQLSVDGGSVAFKAGGPVVFQKESTVDVSGGYIDFQGGYVRTTKLLSEGHVYDIALATADRVYDGIYTGTTTRKDAKWGVEESTANPLTQSVYENGYRQGGSGGSVAIAAPVLALDGMLRGNTVVGSMQRTISPVFNPASPPDAANPVLAGVSNWLLGALNRPIPGQFSLSIGRQYRTAAGNYSGYSPIPTNIIFRNSVVARPVGAFNASASYLFPTQRNHELELTPSLFGEQGSGFGIVRVDNSDDDVGLSSGFGNITIKAGTTLTFAPASSFTLSAGSITVENGARLLSSGGRIALNAYGVSPSLAESIAFQGSAGETVPEDQLPRYNPLRGNVSIGTGAVLSTAGELIDERTTSATAGTLPLVTTGGSIAINASDIALKSGSALSVSGGATMSSSGKLSYGDAGSITLNAGRALGGGFGVVAGGRLSLTGASLEGFAGVGRKGGSLTLQAPSVLLQNGSGDATTTNNASGALTLAPRFFNNGGFGSFSLTGLGVSVGPDLSMIGSAPALTVAPNTRVEPAVQNWENLPGGSVFLAQEGTRKPASLSLKTAALFANVNGILLGNNVDLLVGAGAVLQPDAGGGVVLEGGSIDLLGRITTYGGTVGLTQAAGGQPYVPGIHLGPLSVLDVSGRSVSTLDFTGYHKSDVLDGGTISIEGNLVAEKGSSLNVAGSSDTILVAPGEIPAGVPTNPGEQLVAIVKDSNGGKISLTADEVLFFGATLHGGTGGPGGRDGDLVVISRRAGSALFGTSTRPGPSDVVLTLTSLTPDFVYHGFGQAVTNPAGAPFGDEKALGTTWFGADTFTNGHFGGLTLSVGSGSGALEVRSDVALTASRQISIADSGILAFRTDSSATKPSSSLTLTAPYVVLGRAFRGPLQASEQSNPFVQNVSATHGSGTLAVRAGNLIDVGTLSLQNAGAVILDATFRGQSGASQGAIRGDGVLDVAGDLTLKAAQIYPPTAVSFTLIASDYSEGSVTKPGSISIQSAGGSAPAALPLSAGGTLNLYAAQITQGGTLRAPLGTINLGTEDSAALNPLSGKSLPTGSKLTLESGSVTSVSAIDPATGKPVAIPFGVNVNGDTWIDPTGVDITNLGPAAKSITLAAAAIDFQGANANKSAAQIDLSGGGDLFSYQFVPGTGGTTDILLGSTAGAFAIVPGYTDSFAPEARYNGSTDARAALASDPGYVIGNSKLNYVAGDRIHLEAAGNLPAGDYTLLPARYALLPGAYLVTPQSGAGNAGGAPGVLQADGASIVAGYRFNGLADTGQKQSVFRSFEVAPQAVVLGRAAYKQYSANTFFSETAAGNENVAPRLPVDAGRLGLLAGSSLRLKGNVLAQAAPGGRSGLVDISSSADILIGSHAVVAASEAVGGSGLLLEAKELSSFGAESLLIGGVRSSDAKGTTVTVKTNRIVVDNAGEPLFGPDVILAANSGLTLTAGAEVGKADQAWVAADPLRVVGAVALNGVGESVSFSRGGLPISLPNGTPGNGKLTSTSAGTITRADGTTTAFLATSGGSTNAFSVPAGATVTLERNGNLRFASSTDAVIKPIPLALGDGTLLRVSSDPAAITRVGVASSNVPALSLGAGVKIAGASAIIDSTNTTNLSEQLDLSTVRSLGLNSGRISLVLDQPGTIASAGSLVLSRAAQDSLLKSASALSLLSYSTIDFHGTGTFGSSSLNSLSLHAGALRGFLNSTDSAAKVTVSAKSVALDNAANALAPVAGSSLGNLVIETGALRLGENQLQVQNFAQVTVNAAEGVLAGDATKLGLRSGGLAVKGGGLAISTPLITSAGRSNQSIVADGSLSLNSSVGTATVSSGLGASLNLTGETVSVGTTVRVPSGVLTVHATGGDLSVVGGTLDASGTAQHFIEVTKYTDGGRINLVADAGNMTIAAGSKVSVASDAGGGSAGTLTLSIPAGTFSIASGTLAGKATTGGAGSFVLDTAGIPGADPAASHLATLADTLSRGGFARSVELRIREGNVVADGEIRAHDYSLAADHGSISVTGTIDASGFIGATRSSPLGGTMDEADPTGGKIDLSASGSVVLAPSAWLSAAGFAYNNAGRGGAISLSAGSYVFRDGSGQVDPAAVVDIQPGARLDLGVKHAFTPNDLLLNPDVALPVGTRTDLSTGTLQVREPQNTFGTGAQFATLGNSVNGASGIVLEGVQIFDLTATNGAVSTSGAVTSVGSGGLVDFAVQKAVKDNGAAFVAGVSSTLLGDPLIHVRPGGEIVNNAAVGPAVTRNFVTLNSSVAATRSVVNFNLKPGSGIFTTALIPGGLPMGVTLKTTPGRVFTLTTADGAVSAQITANANTTIASASAANPVVAVNFRNTGATALSTQLNFNTGTTPVTAAFDAGTTITTTPFAGRYSSSAGDLTLANTWDLSTYRFGPGLEPGRLTLRARGNLLVGFDASLNDGFDPTNAVDGNNPLWTAQLMSGDSWSYRLLAGADYAAADPRAVLSGGKLQPGSGSVLFGLGGLTLPTAPPNPVSRATIIPRYFQTIRTGTGSIDVVAGRDVQFLNPLATIYTAGRKAGALAEFDVPVLDSTIDRDAPFSAYYPAQYSLSGGDVSIRAKNDIARYLGNGTSLAQNSSKELPSNWLYRRGNVGPDGRFVAFGGANPPSTEIQSTSWWVDFSNFFADVGALGGGNVALIAGRNVTNVQAAAPTNARMPSRDSAGKPAVPVPASLVELGGGDILVQAGADIDGGIYYVERGSALLRAAGAVTTNSTRVAYNAGSTTHPARWLPTTFFLGKGRIDIAAGGDIQIGAVANPFWLPQGAGNRLYETSYFSTFDRNNEVTISSLGGNITLQVRPDTDSAASLIPWYTNVMSLLPAATAASQPWLRLAPLAFNGVITPVSDFQTVAGILPSTLAATAFAGDINLVGRLTLAPSPRGSLDLLAGGAINGFRVNGVNLAISDWGSAAISLSDADPARLPDITKPISNDLYTRFGPQRVLAQVDALFADSGRVNLSLEEKLALHGHTIDAAGKSVPLHYDDSEPLRLYATGGSLSGVTLYSGKSARVIAAKDLTDVALYIQNTRGEDNALVAAGRDIIAYNPASPLRVAAQQPGNTVSGIAGSTIPASGTPTAGDIQIAGPGTLQVLAGRNLDLGSGSLPKKDGTAVGVTSVGSTRNPYLPQNSGANIIAAAGIGGVYNATASVRGQSPGLATTGLKFDSFVAQFLDPAKAGSKATRYLPELGKLMGLASTDSATIWKAFGLAPDGILTERQAALLLGIFNRVLRESARDRNDPKSPTFGKYTDGFAAISALFPASPEPTEAEMASQSDVDRPSGPWNGRLSMPTRLIKTFEGGDITLVVPGGAITVGRATDPQKPDQGILTERGGGISIYAADSVAVGTSRIFTLRGGDEIVWSTWGDIAAGSGSKTVFTAPPTRVLVDPQSGDVKNDLAGLATGSGIGVLATLAGVKPGNVDLIAPTGAIDAGDAGIRSSGNLNLAARVILNAANIQVGGTTAGAPPAPAAPNLGSITAASNTSAAATSSSNEVARRGAAANPPAEFPSIFTVEVLGYGGGEGDEAAAGSGESDDWEKIKDFAYPQRAGFLAAVENIMGRFDPKASSPGEPIPGFALAREALVQARAALLSASAETWPAAKEEFRNAWREAEAELAKARGR